MHLLIATVVSVFLGITSGFWRGPIGLEMLNSTERVSIAAGLLLAIVAAILLNKRRPARWIQALIPIALFLAFATGAWLIFEPRFHLNFYPNGIACMARSIPAAAVSLSIALFVLKIKPGSAIALLAAVSAITAQTIFCSIVETRHIIIFHSTALLLWPLVAFCFWKPTAVLSAS